MTSKLNQLKSAKGLFESAAGSLSVDDKVGLIAEGLAALAEVLTEMNQELESFKKELANKKRN